MKAQMPRTQICIYQTNSSSILRFFSSLHQTILHASTINQRYNSTFGSDSFNTLLRIKTFLKTRNQVMHFVSRLRPRHAKGRSHDDKLEDQSVASQESRQSSVLHVEKLNKLFPKKNQSKKEEIELEDLSSKLIPVIGKSRFMILVRNLFTAEECANLIEMGESYGYEEDWSDISNCGRVDITDTDLAELWFERVLQVVEGTSVKEKLASAPWTIKDGDPAAKSHFRIVGINERLRFLRFLPGQQYDRHQDNQYIRGEEFGEKEGETSQLTFLLYLNNDKMKGGETRISSAVRYLDVTPETGSVLIFDQEIFHEVNPLIKGKQYVIRSDFMYANIHDGTR